MITHKGSRSNEREPYFLSYIKLEAVVNVNVQFLAFGMVAFLVAVCYAVALLTFVSFNAYQAEEAAIDHYVIPDGKNTIAGFNFHIAVGIAKCPDVGQVYSRAYSPAIVVNDFLFNAYANRQQPDVLTFHIIHETATFSSIVISINAHETQTSVRNDLHIFVLVEFFYFYACRQSSSFRASFQGTTSTVLSYIAISFCIIDVKDDVAVIIMDVTIVGNAKKIYLHYTPQEGAMVLKFLF